MLSILCCNMHNAYILCAAYIVHCVIPLQSERCKMHLCTIHTLLSSTKFSIKFSIKFSTKFSIKFSTQLALQASCTLLMTHSVNGMLYACSKLVDCHTLTLIFEIFYLYLSMFHQRYQT